VKPTCSPLTHMLFLKDHSRIVPGLACNVSLVMLQCIPCAYTHVMTCDARHVSADVHRTTDPTATALTIHPKLRPKLTNIRILTDSVWHRRQRCRRNSTLPKPELQIGTERASCWSLLDTTGQSGPSGFVKGINPGPPDLTEGAAAALPIPS
jgi:hypothetical protein